MEATDKTEVLVSVGYSFPFFNRDIDRRIIHNMGKLKKVYLQALPEHREELLDHFGSVVERAGVHSPEIEFKGGTGSFYLPKEL
jgi:hypothetical protein